MIERRDGATLRTLLGAAVGALVVALAVAVSGGLELRVGGALIRSHSPMPAAIAAMLLLVAASGFGRPAVATALEWWWAAIQRRASAAALVLALLTIGVAAQWGTYVAGGSDSYCYLNQAELFARGEVHDSEPLALDPAWPGTPGAFVPSGHTAVPGRPGAFAPICPAGYPILLSAARTVGGRSAMFWITPLMAGAVVWLAFLLGRRAAGSSAGLLTAVLTAASPAFLFQAMQVMNDVTVTAAWCAALVASARVGSPTTRAIVTGALAGSALVVRPNLVPLAAILGLTQVLSPPLPLRNAVRPALAFAVALLPGVLIVMAVQNATYGSPFRSGYGDLSGLFSASNIAANLARYPKWLIEVHTPLILVAAFAPLVARGTDARRYSGLLLAFAATVFACYLPYAVFEDWWYLRFVLPAIPPLLALTSVVVCRGIDRLAVAWRPIAFVAVATVLAIVMATIAAQRGTFGSRDFEWRYRAAGEYIAARMPSHAAFVTGHQTGSIRFYSARSTAGWGDIEPGRLDEALDFLRRHGRKPYLLFEAWEEPHFRSRFRGDRLGELGWPPAAEINQTVRIYDPDDYDRYRRGDTIATDRVIRRR